MIGVIRSPGSRQMPPEPAPRTRCADTSGQISHLKRKKICRRLEPLRYGIHPLKPRKISKSREEDLDIIGQRLLSVCGPLHRCYTTTHLANLPVIRRSQGEWKRLMTRLPSYSGQRNAQARIRFGAPRANVVCRYKGLRFPSRCELCLSRFSIQTVIFVSE